jgi:type I restriction enzyme, S subunit
MRQIEIKRITNNLDSRRIPLNSSQRAEKETNPMYPYIGANNIMAYIDEYIFDDKILCIAEDGGSWGFMQTCAKIYNEKVWVNNHAHVLTAKEELVLEYLKYYLNYADLSLYINGATRGKLTKSSLNTIKIPLPPLEEQKKIAAILDAADDYRQKTKALIEKYDQLTKSLFLDMFGDLCLKNTKWDILKIREVVLEYKSGASIKPAEFTQTGFPVLHKGAIKINGGIQVDNKKNAFVSSDACTKFKKSIVNKKYLVVTLRDLVPTGPSIGLISHLRDYEIDQYILAQGAYGLLLNEKLVNPTYVVHWSNSLAYREKLSRYWVGSTQIHLRSSVFFDLDMPVPSIELQNEFAEWVALIEKQKQQAEASLVKAEELFNSLLQRAFKGELTN